MTAVTMYDTVGANANRIPHTAVKVAGYVTGSGIVPWLTEDWEYFPHAGHVRIDQSIGGISPISSDVLDVESGAATPTDAVNWVLTRISRGIQWSTIYGTSSTLAAVYKALAGLIPGKPQWFYGHVDCWLANWSLDQNGAEELLGKQVQGLTCRAVQWASPTSNPNTIVPGSTQTLSELNVDLSVTQSDWHAYIPDVPFK